MSARQDGFVLIAVLWILSALAGLIAIFSAYTLTSAANSDVYVRQVRADAVVAGAVELAVMALTRDPKTPPPAFGALNFRIADAYANVGFESEARRVDLNMAGEDSLSRVFVDLGVKSAAAEIYVARIIGWRTRSDQDASNAEDLEYKAAGLGYWPRKASFEQADELWSLLGLPPALIEAALPRLTLYAPRVETSSAPQQDRSGGLTPPPAARPSTAAPQPHPFATSADAGRLQPTRLDIRVTFDDGRNAAAEVVVTSLRDGDEPYYVLSWRDGDRRTPR